MLGAPVRSVAEALAGIAGIRERFQRDYQAMLGPVLARRLPLAVCTIYDRPRFADPARRSATVVALGAFNDIITREAFSRGLPVIDLRLVCAEDEDFAAPTGPSVRGGGKIAATSASSLRGMIPPHGIPRSIQAMPDRPVHAIAFPNHALSENSVAGCARRHSAVPHRDHPAD